MNTEELKKLFAEYIEYSSKKSLHYEYPDEYYCSAKSWDEDTFASFIEWLEKNNNEHSNS